MLRTLILGGALVVVVLASAACSAGTQTPTASTTASVPVETQATTPSATSTESTAPSSTSETVTELQIKDTVVGKGAAASAGDSITVNYTGWLMDGTKFDSSIGKTPYSFVLGGGRVIEGWDKGVVGMKVGGTRQLIIPSAMGYGPQGYPPAIPPNATLKFEVQLLAVGPVTP